LSYAGTGGHDDPAAVIVCRPPATGRPGHVTKLKPTNPRSAS